NCLAYIPADCVKFSASPENIVSIAPDGTVTGVGAGETTICAEVDFRGDKFSVYADVVVEKHSGKTEPTYYTYEKREIAKENIQKYDWAKSEKSSVVNTAEKYVTNYELLYNMAPREGLPRARQVSNVNDSEYYKYCRYCGGDVEGATGGGYGGWNCDPISRPWKIQCPECKRLFPSNDFETLYEYGLDENGVYDAERARRVNAEKVAAGEKDALRNELYPEIGSQRTPENGGEAGVTVTLNNGRGLRPGETVEGWGVDDGWGYRPKDVNGNNYKIATGDIEIHCYIPRYVWQFWDTYQTAIESLGTAYVNTGEEKYGRAGAILLDRFADLIPEYDLNKQYVKDSYRLNNYSTGYIRNNISDVDSFVDIAFMTDALFPMTADSQVQSFLSAKAEQLGLENKKDTREAIWDNWKEGILLELFYNGVKRGRLTGNFGMYQRFAAILAVSLSEEPESSEIIDWIYSAGDSAAAIIVGGNVLPQLVDEICRDGFGTESGDNYLSYWYSYSYQVGEILEEFKTDKKVDLWKHPKFARMFTAFKKKILVNKTLAQVGDSAATASTGMTGDMNAFIDAFMKYKDTDFGKDIAQYIYTKSKFNMDGIHYDIFTKDPESIQKEILNYVTDNPEQKSDLMAGYGFAILRDGESYESAQGATKTNSLRDAWIYFGAAKSHAHYDNLNLGLEAFGLNIAPDNGYPERTGKDANRYQWHNSTISHNTVTVDGKPSTKPKENNGLPMHFDDTSFVKLVDVDANASYDVTDKYRRTLVMVKVNDDISYTMDFFRIKGGDSHIYSFHSQAENAVAVDGLTMTPQQDENGNWVGTYVSNIGPDGKEYVGIDVPYQDKNGSWKDAKGNPYIFSEVGQDPHTIEAWDYETYFPKGFTWLGKVRRDRAPQSEFAVEFEVEDYRKTIADNKGIRL
ncbi:MAG: heparinase II/III family protein, partial [Oscillospiraceae bacterium]|nr:heparinase II/III family protein [Oscillospiraceae bacterium]